MNIGIVGIHTGIGKTICSAILCQAIKADYWKPVQAGTLEQSDSIIVEQLVSKKITIHRETYRLHTPASPHYAADLEGITIQVSDCKLPDTEGHLIIETAGGLLSPLSSNCLNLDLIQKLKCPVVVISENYLGSINHTLLTLKVLKDAGIRVLGIVFNGEKNEASEEFILHYSGVPLLFSIPKFENVNAESIARFCDSILPQMRLLLE